ncbi:relaxase/mobilization nuclease domain-containing protein [Pontibacter korlensis]|uniref:relaxase/mobilization nuclease domain-containing protein n=1 Tax=Pontibacter korlensis TaxID=400092 RepID=UPI00130DCCE1|nr:relaxase/mobilization nuclease domain-containing protein [Pontibacter korlensis]
MSKNIAQVVAYVADKPQARVLAADGVRTDCVQHMIRDFALIGKLNPDLKIKAGHISLSWNRQDREKLSPEVMVARAREYMEKMGIRDTQYLVVAHRDTPHPHLHIVYNRVSYKGQRIEDHFQLSRSRQVLRDMRDRYGYHMPTGKQAVNRKRLNSFETERFALYDAIEPALREAKSWEELRKRLQRRGITLRFKQEGDTGKVLGVSFKQGTYSFKGSRIDPALSYGKISQRLEHNLQARLQRIEKGVAGRQRFYRYGPSIFSKTAPVKNLPLEKLFLDRQALQNTYPRPFAALGPEVIGPKSKQENRQAYSKSIWKW